MPITKSAIKRARQQKKRRAYNLKIKKALKAKLKAFYQHIETKKSQEARQALREAISQIDKAQKRKLLHKNTAARRKSRITLAYNQISKEAYGAEKPIKKSPSRSKKTSKKSVAKTKQKKAQS